MKLWTKFPNYRQLDRMDCGPTCVQMVAKYFGLDVPRETLRKRCTLQKNGTSFEGMIHGLKTLGIEALAVKADFAELETELPLPLIAHWNNNHFVVVHKVSKRRIYVSDPALGLVSYPHADFKQNWSPDGAGLAVLVEAVPVRPIEEIEENNKGLQYLWYQLLHFKGHLGQLAIGLFLAMTIQLLLPFMTQSLVDVGIDNRDTPFIHLVLLAYGTLFLVRMVSEWLREGLLLQLTNRVRIEMVTRYLQRILVMPMAFFDQKNTGDFIQRINDHQHVEDFVGGNALSILFDIFGLLVFGLVLALFDGTVFTIFALGAIGFFGWSLLFMPVKERLDHQRFEKQRREQSLVLQMILAVQDIKLNGSQERRIQEWKANVHQLFGLERHTLKIDLAQLKGGMFLMETTFLVILLVSAKAVVSGKLTLGTLLAIQFIMGSLALPLSNIVRYLVGWQRAKLSLERLTEVHGKPAEKTNNVSLPIKHSPMIKVQNIRFGYGGITQAAMLEGISFQVPYGGTLAIVGPSGSGKSTLLKLLLKLYEPQEGEISIGGTPLRLLGAKDWRRSCGAILQDSRLFNDTVARNITQTDAQGPLDGHWLAEVMERTHLAEVVKGLPLGLDTHIGENGQLLSGGERQRLLLARALYKKPDFLFLDEPTSALDGQNEHDIMEALLGDDNERTLVVVAHRLSTIKTADHIVVLEKGRIVQQGTHESLIGKDGCYQRLMGQQV